MVDLRELGYFRSWDDVKGEGHSNQITNQNHMLHKYHDNQKEMFCLSSSYRTMNNRNGNDRLSSIVHTVIIGNKKKNSVHLRLIRRNN